MPIIRNYHPADEASWLRCRVLAFLDTCYYDDVWTACPTDSEIQLVAVEGRQVVGILDVALDGPLATIDTVCVHPDHRQRGIATALLQQALTRLPAGIDTLDAWTREDAGTLAWYRASGFTESEHYLHVYLSWDDTHPSDWAAPAPLGRPVQAFWHARLEHEAELRERFRRVYVCRRFSRPLPAA